LVLPPPGGLALSCRYSPPSPGALSVCVIGGGVSGCAAASFLREMFVDQEDLRITILEKSAKLGGRISLVEFAGQRYEVPPHARPSIPQESNDPTW